MKIRPFYLWMVFLLMLIIALVRTHPELSSTAENKEFLMGTPIRVKVEGPNAPRLANLAIEEIRRLDRLFSKFNPQSEVYQLNSGKKIRLSPDTSRILEEANKLAKLTQGAFDVNLGQAGGEIDLGAIAKGYAAESARKLLLKKGAKSGMIDMRSSIAVFGPKAWKVGIQHPRDRKKLIGAVVLENGESLATSGDYERGEHILDPRTGKPARECQSVTIVGKDAAETDAFSTAVFVLGPKRGMDLVESLPGIEALMVDRNGKIIKSTGLILAKP